MANPEISVIVLTGGPCGGKSTLLPIAKQWLEDHGYLVAILQEVATEVISSGLPPFGIWADNLTFQEHLIKYQVDREDRYIEMLATRTGDKPRVLLCDRGCIDSMAFTGRAGFLEVLSRCGLNLQQLRNRYTAVVHLMSAARGAPEFYTLANNTARSETAEQAAALDVRLEQAWLGHPHFTVVDNSSEFSDKVRRALAAFSRVLHIPAPLEIERKFFVRSYTLPDVHVAVEIEQVYLKSTEQEPERRVRKRTLDGVTSWFYTTKEATATPGVRVEKERQIELGEYERLLEEQDLSLKPIRKTRYCFLYEGRHLELDVFHGALQGLVLLEIELSAMSDTFSIPADWDAPEVTGNKFFSNKALAGRKFDDVHFRREAFMPGYTEALQEWLS
jgi:CYTH domain-containing protein/predicted ATPase